MAAGCEPKVSNFHIFNAIWASADKDILGLEISMDNVEAVDVGKSLEDLAEQTPDFLCLLGQVPRYQVAQSLGVVSLGVKETLGQSTNLLVSRSIPWKYT